MTEAEQMLKDCIKRHEKLSAWESGFIQSLQDMDDFGGLSPKQYETLEIIWDRVTS